MQPDLEDFFRKVIFCFSKFLKNSNEICNQILDSTVEKNNDGMDENESKQLAVSTKKSINQINEPKKPRSCFIYFCQHIRSKNQEKLKKITLLEQNVLFGNAWRNLSEDKKQVFKKLADKDKKRYLKEVKIIENKDESKNQQNKIQNKINKQKQDPPPIIQQKAKQSILQQNKNQEIPTDLNIDQNKSSYSLKTRAQKKLEQFGLPEQQDKQIMSILQKDQIDEAKQKSEEYQISQKNNVKDMEGKTFNKSLDLSANSNEENDINSVDKESSISQKIIGFLKSQNTENICQNKNQIGIPQIIDESPEYEVIDKRKLMKKKQK